jgi:hypothetical protein
VLQKKRVNGKFQKERNLPVKVGEVYKLPSDVKRARSYPEQTVLLFSRLTWTLLGRFLQERFIQYLSRIVPICLTGDRAGSSHSRYIAVVYRVESHDYINIELLDLATFNSRVGIFTPMLCSIFTITHRSRFFMSLSSDKSNMTR